MLVLGLETSCDETAAAVVDESYAVHSNIIFSQQDHAPYGGVVPELASRAHMRALVPVVRQALATADIGWEEVDGVAATRGPGLVGSLIVGLSLAKGLALARNKPLIGVHHLEAHVFSNLVAAQVEVSFSDTAGVGRAHRVDFGARTRLIRGAGPHARRRSRRGI